MSLLRQHTLAILVLACSACHASPHLSRTAVIQAERPEDTAPWTNPLLDTLRTTFQQETQSIGQVEILEMRQLWSPPRSG